MNTNLKGIYHKVDLCVVGGGLAGMCAAVAAARHGIKVALMHVFNRSKLCFYL